MIDYNSFRYIYPPRPKTAVPPTSLRLFKGYLGQPKLNGDCLLIFTNGKEFHVYNRHNKKKVLFKLSTEELKRIYRGTGWMVIVGEYLDKSQEDESMTKFNHKLCIFDILVYNSKYLLRTTFRERYDLLNELYGNPVEDKPFLHKITENIYKVVEIKGDYTETFNKLMKYGKVYEGVILKRENALLEPGTTESNNIKPQIKSRRPTPNYAY